MPLENLLTRLRPRQAEAENATSEPEASPILEQARAYGQVAREARDDCERGVDAERQLMQRYNRPGQ